MISIRFWQNINQELLMLNTFINSENIFGNFAKECLVV